ncbi:unnamed protein product [Moneuplotes crassus]|uniref:Uncharacterized protein n=1 Tax=Euplotes crassus TaxID=5936 RepID=A0AAD1XZP3_EUPCR|nr:unnamed protein product [Moneuplotes crassus]
MGMKLQSFTRSIDIYGAGITLNYKGHYRFQTTFGGIVGILVAITLIGFSTSLILNMFRRSEVMFNDSSIMRDPSTDTTEHFPAQKGFAIAFGLRDSDHSFLDEHYLKMFNLEVFQRTTVKLSNGDTNITNEKLEVTRCEDYLPYQNKTILKTFKIDKYVCVKPTNYVISGNWYTDVLKNLRITVEKCTTLVRDDCAEEDTINSELGGYWFDVVMIDSYFDRKSFSNPIKSYLTQKYFYTLEDGFFSNTDIFLRENILNMHDDYTLLEGSKDGKFYSVAGEKTSRYKWSYRHLGRVNLYLDAETVTYERQVFTVADLLGNIGGIFSLLQSLAGIIVGMYADRVFKHSIISKLYTFDTDEIDNKSDLDEADLPCDSQKKINLKDNIYNGSYRQDFELEEDKKHDSEEDEGGEPQIPVVHKDKRCEINEEEAHSLLNTMKGKRRYGYTPLDSLYGLFCIFKKKTWCRRRYKNSQIYQKGLNRYCQDLDAANIVQNLHNLNLLMGIIFNDRQRVLSKFSRERSINNEDGYMQNSMDMILQYKCTNFEAKKEQYHEAVQDFVNNLKASELSEYDKRLINQIEPGLMPIDESSLVSKVHTSKKSSDSPAPDRKNVAEVETLKRRNSPDRVCASPDDVKLELKDNNPQSKPRPDLLDDEDKVSSELEDIGIRNNTQGEILCARKRLQ